VVCRTPGIRDGRDLAAGTSGELGEHATMPIYEKPDLYSMREGGVWHAYIRMTGVHALYETVRGKSFVKKPLMKEPFGDWDFEIEDLNGYVVVFGGDEGVPA
jgi:hypothetical protein